MNTDPCSLFSDPKFIRYGYYAGYLTHWSSTDIGLVFSGKISSSGTLTFQFPSPLFVDPVNGPFYITDVIKGHACAEIWGEGVNQGTLFFRGEFDGTRFTATAKFMAKVSSPCPSNDMFDPALVEGNLHWIFGYDLTID